MKTIIIPLIGLLAIAQVQAGPFGKKKGPHRGVTKENIGKRGAMQEEQILDHLDTHKWKKDPEATDQRPSDLNRYHIRTHSRIVSLLRHGAISDENGKIFKEKHTAITLSGKEFRADGEMSADEVKELRKKLDDLNDEINGALQAAEEGSMRTPLLNQTQHRFEEKIEFGVRSGRLSTGEASRLTRKVEKLKRMEALEKNGGLRTSEREKLFEEAAELAREINKELND